MLPLEVDLADGPPDGLDEVQATRPADSTAPTLPSGAGRDSPSMAAKPGIVPAKICIFRFVRRLDSGRP